MNWKLILCRIGLHRWLTARAMTMRAPIVGYVCKRCGASRKA